MKMFILVGALLMASPAMAQDFQQVQNPPLPGIGPLPGVENGEMSPNEIQKLFDAYLIMEAQQALTLTDQQYPQFLIRVKTLQDTRRRTTQERNQLMSQIQRLTNPRLAMAQQGTDAQVKERLVALQELESRTAAEMRKAYTGIDEVLEVRQQARFRLFEENIERRKIELLMRARQQNRPKNQQGPNAPAVRRPNQPPPPQ